MNKSEHINELATSLAIAQGSIENASKNANNPHFKSKYADLSETLNTIRPVFSENGLSLLQMPSFADGVASVETVLMHKSGQWISETASAPVGKQDAQGVGSAITYLRRYSAAAFAGIAQEDDDANSAVGASPQQANKPATKPAPQAPSNATISDNDLQILQVLLTAANITSEEFCITSKIPSLSALPLSKFAGACEWIKKQSRAAQ